MREIVGILLCLFSFAVYAQHDTDITIGVVVPQTQSELDSKSFHLLATRLENVMGTIGISSSVNGGIILYPEVNILSKQLVEGGLRNITIVELELSLFVKQVMTQTLFGSCSKVLKGSGRIFSDAVCNAFINIKPQDEVYGNFLKQSKEKIVRYYWDNKTNKQTDITVQPFIMLDNGVFTSKISVENNGKIMVKTYIELVRNIVGYNFDGKSVRDGLFNNFEHKDCRGNLEINEYYQIIANRTRLLHYSESSDFFEVYELPENWQITDGISNLEYPKVFDDMYFDMQDKDLEEINNILAARKSIKAISRTRKK